MDATREILWNVNSPFTSMGMYGLLALALLISGFGIYSRIQLWKSGTADPDRIPTVSSFLRDLISWGLFQRGVVRKKAAGFIHTLIYLGFLALLFTTTMVFLHHDLGIPIYRGNFYLALTVLSDLFGLGLIIGCALAYHRRKITGTDLLHNRSPDITFLSVLSLLCIQGFLLEALRIYVTNDPWQRYSFVGAALATFFWGISKSSAQTIHAVIWWFHTVTVMACFAAVPYTKFFHIISSLSNVSLRSSKRPKGALPFPGDLEKVMESAGDDFSIGLGTIGDYTWKQRLDLDACTSCGRCQEVCPAYNTGKPLSPKWIILDTRNHMLSLQAKGQMLDTSGAPAPLVAADQTLLGSFLSSVGVNEADGAFRALNPLVQKAVRPVIGSSPDSKISGDVIDPMAFWSCVTCMACVEACPVGINQVDQIIGNRRNMVLMQGELPSEAQSTLRSLESRANPYGPPEERVQWFKDLDIKVLKPGDEVDYLYWVGCVSSYDQRKQKIARSLVKIMKEAGLSFGVLGSAEGCSGDPARRLGEENLYQTLAKGNLATLTSIKFKTLVANCPHCFNTIKNEYPQLGNLGDGRSPEIIHHSVLLRRLLEDETIKVKETDTSFTFHDSCYLGRYNGEYEAPRETLKKASSLKVIEMQDSREKGMCCGAGGGHFWMDLKIGTRINQKRVEQAAETGAQTIASSCPFCMQMLEDGVKLNNLEGTLDVKDIAEVIAERLLTFEESKA